MNRIIVDVREPEEYERLHIDGAVNMPPSEIMAGAPQLSNTPKDTEIILYCVSGSRSNVATNILRSHGFTNLINGINAQQVSVKFKLPLISQ